MAKVSLHNIRAAMFDLDGTLFDSIDVWTRIDEKFLAARGKVPTPEYKHSIAAMSNIECAKFTIEYYNLNDAPEALVAEWYDMARREYSHSVELMPHAREYLKSVRSRGIKVYAVSSLDKELAEVALKNNGIFELFDGLIFAKNGLSKDKPEIYSHAAQVAKAQASSCVMFDDIVKATRAARNAGMISVAVRNDKSYDDGLSVEADSADYFASSFDDAPELYCD